METARCKPYVVPEIRLPGHEWVFSETWDAMWCNQCKWIESKCSDENCEFCAKRPDEYDPLVDIHPVGDQMFDVDF